MRHSCRCSLHPALTLLVLGTIGSVVGIGIHVWLEPWTSAVAVGIGSMAGMLVSHAIGQDIVLGLVTGALITMFALGVRTVATIVRAHPGPLRVPR